MRVRDIMTSERLATATLDSTLQEIANIMKDEGVGAIPILDDSDRPAGIITDRDIVVRCVALGRDPVSCTAEEIISPQLHTVTPDSEPGEAAELMARYKIRRLPVVEDGTIIGIISLGDLSVKAGTERAGQALEDISAGVSAQRRNSRNARSNGRQGISSRTSNEEKTRQRKMAPMRATGASSNRGKKRAS